MPSPYVMPSPSDMSDLPPPSGTEDAQRLRDKLSELDKEQILREKMKEVDKFREEVIRGFPYVLVEAKAKTFDTHAGLECKGVLPVNRRGGGDDDQAVYAYLLHRKGCTVIPYPNDQENWKCRAYVFGEWSDHWDATKNGLLIWNAFVDDYNKLGQSSSDRDPFNRVYNKMEWKP